MPDYGPESELSESGPYHTLKDSIHNDKSFFKKNKSENELMNFDKTKEADVAEQLLLLFCVLYVCRQKK